MRGRPECDRCGCIHWVGAIGTHTYPQTFPHEARPVPIPWHEQQKRKRRGGGASCPRQRAATRVSLAAHAAAAVPRGARLCRPCRLGVLVKMFNERPVLRRVPAAPGSLDLLDDLVDGRSPPVRFGGACRLVEQVELGVRDAGGLSRPLEAGAMVRPPSAGPLRPSARLCGSKMRFGQTLPTGSRSPTEASVTRGLRKMTGLAAAWDPRFESEQAVRLSIEDWKADASRSLAEQFPELRSALDEGEWSHLVQDLFDASSDKERVRVLMGWYYTLVAQMRPEYAERVAEAKAGKGRRYTSEELRQALGL